ncbi:hypothetical protein DFH08DRAFT_1072546 [Mycena albidolilacea]|uniref:DUF6535 domain-containing protein n=1 Tax=Mycena albidolilacea TaxID=1033008 RepID=A0AAD7F3A3_9AGAR|nr:hypothetical protein DFH08DRAFT_1072546 [Mycena albidolilacea]
MTKNTTILPNLSYVPKQADHDELASAKLWAVYISEAEKYDKALVESWKSDMDGLLIFAGLFSASLTAFLIESYKTLSPDQGAMTIALLAQISRQLDTSSSNTSMATTNPSFTTPSAATLACNILWFFSLGLSLSCALTATLVQQWARDFIQQTEMRPSPVTRARIFSYLYFGMQRFSMHTIVGFIPLLLHLSLLLFFSGLVAFLRPINQVMVIVAALMLGLISVIYIWLTILPIISSDVPYRTPLSNVVWQVYQRLSVMLYWSPKSLWDEEKGQKDDKSPQCNNQQPKQDEECGNTDRKYHHDNRRIPTSLIAVMNQHATECSPQRDDRDGRAIVWTLKSLTDNNELQPFVEALPDLIWGPNGRQHMYDAMIYMLLADRNIQLIQRIESLLQSCDSGLLRSDHEMWRRIACIKALWAIAYFLASDASTQKTFPMFNTNSLSSQHLHSNPEVHLYSVSASAVVQWIGFCAVSQLIQEVLAMLATSPAVQDPGTILAALCTIEHEANARGYTEFSSAISHITGDTMPPLLQLCNTLNSFEDKAYDSFMEYLQSSSGLNEMPFEFQATCEIIQPSLVPISSKVQIKLVQLLDTIISTVGHIGSLESGVHQVDVIVDMVLQLLQPGSESMEIGLGRPIAIYIVYRSRGTGTSLQQWNPKQLSSILTKYLAYLSGGDNTYLTLYSIWSLCIFYPQFAAFTEQTLTVVHGFLQLPHTASVIAVLKLDILSAATELSPDQAHALMDRLQISPSIDLAERLKGAPFMVLVDWLENLSSSSHTLAATFNFLSCRCPKECYPISFQQHFTTWFVDTCNDPSISLKSYVVKLVEAIEDWLNDKNCVEHFDDIEVCRKLKEVLLKRLGVLILAPNESTEVRISVINVIIARLRSSANVDYRPENFVSVDNDVTEPTEEPGSGWTSCGDGYNTPTSQSQ